jgi:hypothetical protein
MPFGHLTPDLAAPNPEIFASQKLPFDPWHLDKKMAPSYAGAHFL